MSFAPRRARSPPNGSRSGLRQEKKRKAPPKPLILGVHSLTNYKIFSRLTAKSRRKALGLGLFGNRRRDNFYEADTLPAGEGVGRPRAASKDARFVLSGRLKSAPRCCILPDPPLDGPSRTARTAGLAWSTNAASPVPQPWRKWSRAGPLVTAIPIALDRDPRRGRARHVGGRGVESLPLSKTAACEEEALAPDLSPFPNLT